MTPVRRLVVFCSCIAAMACESLPGVGGRDRSAETGRIEVIDGVKKKTVPGWVTAARTVMVLALCATIPMLIGVEEGRRLFWTDAATDRITVATDVDLEGGGAVASPAVRTLVQLPTGFAGTRRAPGEKKPTDCAGVTAAASERYARRAALFLVALFVALLTICFPNKRTATAPPAYTEEAYEDTSIDVFIESDKE